MKLIFAIATVLCGLLLSPPTFAEDGIKTVIKGEMTAQQGGASLFIEGFGMTEKGGLTLTRVVLVWKPP
jgi:hypothetical protein